MISAFRRALFRDPATHVAQAAALAMQIGNVIEPFDFILPLNAQG